MTPLPSRGLYAITSSASYTSEALVLRVEKALQGGAAMIQYRDKTSSAAQRLQQVQHLVPLCHRFNAPLIINDDVELARVSGADGVHLGRSDVTIQYARQQLGDGAIIGVSCYN
ncbi:MAG: thiamine-phosphate pyrophosphorylase, partial [Halothiobacillaceae bacterium]